MQAVIVQATPKPDWKGFFPCHVPCALFCARFPCADLYIKKGSSLKEAAFFAANPRFPRHHRPHHHPACDPQR